jgi:hypothetical protein
VRLQLADVRRWDAGVLDQVVRALHGRQSVLIHSGDDLVKVLPVAGWSGPACDDATSAHTALVGELDHLAAGAAVVIKALAQASDAIPAVHSAITEADALARAYGFQVGDAGQVIDTVAPGAPTPGMTADDRARVRAEVADGISQALRTAEDIDADLTDVLQRATHGQFGGGDPTTVEAASAAATADPGLTLPPPPPRGRPSENAGWWASLSPAGRAVLLRDHPDWLGNLDGLPAAVRSQANVARLPAERAQLEQQLTDAQAHIDSLAASGEQYALRDALNHKAEIQAKLDSLTAISGHHGSTSQSRDCGRRRGRG